VSISFNEKRLMIEGMETAWTAASCWSSTCSTQNAAAVSPGLKRSPRSRDQRGFLSKWIRGYEPAFRDHDLGFRMKMPEAQSLITDVGAQIHDRPHRISPGIEDTKARGMKVVKHAFLLFLPRKTISRPSLRTSREAPCGMGSSGYEQII
jgi:hypothetical protein